MANLKSKSNVFRGRKDALAKPTLEQIAERNMRKWEHKQPTTKSVRNINRKSKTQRKELAKTRSDLHNKKLQNNLMKQHIGAGLIFGLVGRWLSKGVTP